jgi:hypothetical protein
VTQVSAKRESACLRRASLKRRRPRFAAFDDGRGGFRTCDLSRVEQAQAAARCCAASLRPAVIGVVAVAPPCVLLRSNFSKFFPTISRRHASAFRRSGCAGAVFVRQVRGAVAELERGMW